MSLLRKLPIRHPFHHACSHIPHNTYMREMHSYGKPRLIFNSCNTFNNWSLTFPKHITTIPYCNSECKEDTNTIEKNNRANYDSHEFDQMTRALYSILCINSIYHFSDFESFIFIDSTTPTYGSHHNSPPLSTF